MFECFSHFPETLRILQTGGNTDKTIPINTFDVDKIDIDENKTYVMVCQRGFNSYKAVEKMKNIYPDLEVLNLTGGISNYE